LALTVAILALVAALYLPTYRSGFVWVDKAVIRDIAWLRQDGDWIGILRQNFYFRPLGIAMFVLEGRLFVVAPGPMHMVSLGLHLCNTLLVGLLAQPLLRTAYAARFPRSVALSMLLYGLHPALIEPVVWISCQFDLLVVFFTLLGLLLNSSVRQSALRAPGVAMCFFLAACAKESAVVFPLLLFVLDWTAQPGTGSKTTLHALWKRQWPTYLSLLVAGIVYLALRYQVLAVLVQPGSNEQFLSLRRFQIVCALLLTYWRILLWPMVNQGPLHEIDTGAFGSISPMLLAGDLAAVVFVVAGLLLFVKRTPIGGLVAASTVALLPVLRIVPVDFDSSLYHERYAMTAIAMGCALFPSVLASVRLPSGRGHAIALAGSALVLCWLAISAFNIRVTLPLWSDETRLWLWVLQKNPESVLAKNHLLSAFIERDDREHARAVANLLLVESKPCPVCLINVAIQALSDSNVETAKKALDRVQPLLKRVNQPRLTQAFTLASGRLLELQGNPEGAEDAYRRAIALEPLDPHARMTLALLLARQGNRLEAESQAQQALALFPPDDRATQQQHFEQTLAASRAANSPPAQ